MAETIYSPDFENKLPSLQLAYEQYNKNNVSEASLLIQSIGNVHPSHYSIYILKSECAFSLGENQKALKSLNEALDHWEKNREITKESLLIKIRLLLLRSKVYNAMNQREKQGKDLEEVKRISQNELARCGGDKTKIEQILNGEIEKLNGSVNGKMDVHKSKKEREQEAETVFNLMELSEEKGLLTTNNGMVHIISMGWFEKWKRYTNFEAITAKKSKKGGRENGVGALNDTDTDTEGEALYPGPIIQDDILEPVGNLLIDLDPAEQHCNYVIKYGLIENKDFMIVSHIVWKYLHNIYSGTDIKRYVISKDSTNKNTSVEVWLKKVNILACPPPFKSEDYSLCKLQTVYISKLDNVGSLVEKITRIYQTLYSGLNDNVHISSCQLWKLDPSEDYKEVVQRAEDSQGAVIINGSRLEYNKILDDAEIAENDVLICEYFPDRKSSKFRLDSQENNNAEESSEKEAPETPKSSELLSPVVPAKAQENNNCSYCSKERAKLEKCICGAAKYCDTVCQKNDWSKHKQLCQEIRAPELRAAEIIKQFKISNSKFNNNSRYGLCGLQNLGNTCFMNSALQCLSNIKELTYYFIENRFVLDLNRDNKLGTGGKCAAAYGELIKQLWHGTSNSVSPWEVKRMLSAMAAQFEGFSQQDSQEFLSFLLDGVHEDLNKITKKPYIETKESEGGEDAPLAKESWENHLKRNQSMIVDLMYGQYRSQVTCPDCKRSPITFDPFLSLSLPIPSNNPITFFIYFIYKNSDLVPSKVTLTLLPDAPTSEIKVELAKVLNIPKETIALQLVNERAFVQSDSFPKTVKGLKESEATAFGYQIYNEKLDGDLENFLKEEKAEFEIQIHHVSPGSNATERESFSRYLKIPVKSTVYDLKVQVYSLLRMYFAVLFGEKEKSKFYFKVEKGSFELETIRGELEAMLQLSGQPKKYVAYELNIRKASLKRKQRAALPDDETKIGDILEGNSRQFIVEVLLHEKIDTDDMKLNRCKAIEASNIKPKESDSCTLYECFHQFIKPEVLDQNNLWYCSKCKDHKQATKKMDVYKTSKILIIHLKRFKTNRVHSIGSYYFSGGSQKIGTLVDFPLEGLDLSKYVLGKDEEPAIYDLEGVVNHYGGMGGGHYTAYAKNPHKNLWYEFDDSAVSKQSPNEVVSKAAYILFYRRRETDPLNSLG